jgi:hypothetical protein
VPVDDHEGEARLIVEQVAIGDDQVGDLARLDRAELLLCAQDPAAERVAARRAASRDRPWRTAVRRPATNSAPEDRPSE